MEKNKQLSDAEELKNEVTLALEHEKGKVISLETMLDEKNGAFQMVFDEKESLLATVNGLQIEKDELKHTLGTLITQS